MKQFLQGLVFLALVGTVLRLLERRFSAVPPGRLFARARVVDLAHWTLGAPLGRAAADLSFVVAALLVLPALVIQRAGLPAGGQDYVTPFMRLPLVVQAPLALLLVDFFGYWSHRLQHASPLWRFHAIHHSSRELDWLAAARNHPLAEAAGRVLVVAPLLLIGVDVRILAGIVPLLGLWALFLHANVRWTFGPLRYVVATPLFHRWHHSRALAARDKNFAGLFPVWDLLFGTFYLPDRQPSEFGVDDHEAVPEGFIAQMIHPLRRRIRRITEPRRT